MSGLTVERRTHKMTNAKADLTSAQQKDQQKSDLPKLSNPAHRALAAAGVYRLAQLTKFSEAEVKQWHGVGPNALIQLKHALRTNGLSFSKAK